MNRKLFIIVLCLLFTFGTVYSAGLRLRPIKGRSTRCEGLIINAEVEQNVIFLSTNVVSNNVKIEILDNNNNVVVSNFIPYIDPNYDRSIDISFLPTGSYFISVTINNNVYSGEFTK